MFTFFLKVDNLYQNNVLLNNIVTLDSILKTLPNSSFQNSNQMCSSRFTRNSIDLFIKPNQICDSNSISFNNLEVFSSANSLIPINLNKEII